MSGPTRVGDHLDDWRVKVERAKDKQHPRLRVAREPEVDFEALQLERWTETVGPRLAGATVDTLDGDLRRWVDEWVDTPHADLVLLGPVGCGKTWAATAAARARFDGGARVQWWTVPALLEAMRPDGDRPLAAVQHADVLVLDDLGRDKPTDWTLEQLHLVLDHRHRFMLPTVVTSNWSPADLPGRVGRQVASRLLGGDTIGGVPSDGQDRRLS